MNHRAHLHSIHLPISEIGTPYLWFDSLSGTESINDLFHYQLIVKTKDALGRPAHGIVGLDGYVNADHYHQTLTQADPLSQQTAAVSPASHLDMQTLVGTTIGISIDLNDIQPLDNQTITGTCYKHALIIAISQRTTHNLHAVYELTLAPWLYLLTQTNNYRIYQNQSIPYILEDILSHYPYPVEYRLNHHYDTLDYQTQYNESDYAFITRLMSEHGINFYFEHQKDNHILIITDHNSHFTPQDNPFYQTLTIYPPNQRMPEYAEYLEHFIPTQQLTPGQLLVSDYQFKTPSTPIITHDTHPWHTANNHLQQYHWQQGRRVNQSGLQTLTNTLMQQQHQQGLRAKGQGHLKGLQVGHYFTLTNHPNQDSNIQWLILSISITIENLNPDNRTHQYYTANTTFSAQPLKEPLTPDVIHPKPIAYTQTATVVVPEGEEIHTDQYGRIKVKFHWDRPSNEQRHILAQPDSTIINTCWLRVAKPWSGNHYGTINLPRKDQEVIIDFFGGNPDMPYISGTLNNPEHMPLYTLPDGQVLSGIKSKEYQGSQSNQLIMDDTPGKLQLQLKSDHLHSELNLGHIRRITPIQGRQEYRGEGFELRSDGHGVLRADKGMVISTHGRQASNSHIKDIEETIAQLQEATHQHQTQLQASIDALCEERVLDDTTISALQTQNLSLKGEINSTRGGDNNNDNDDKDEEALSYPQLSKPDIAITSLAGITLTAKQNIHLTTENNLAMTTGKDLSFATTAKYNLTTQNGIRVFTQTGGIKHYSAKDDIELQAQDGKLKHIAKDNIEIISTENSIHITAPKELRIKVAGSELLINEQGIFLTTPNTFQVKSNEKVMEGGERVLAELPSFPTSGIYSRRFDFSQLFDLEELKRGVKYKLINHSKNTSMTGFLDELGRTTRVFGNDQDEIEAVIIGHDNSDELIMYEVQDNFSVSDSDESICCACETEDMKLNSMDNNLNIEDNLEEDYHDFGS